MKRIILFLLLLLSTPCLAFGPAIRAVLSSSSAVSSYTALDASTATEVDAGNDITITNATTVTLVDFMARYDTSYVYHDLGADYFNGDFTIRATINLTQNDNVAHPFAMCLTKKVADMYAIDTGTAEDDDVIGVRFYSTGISCGIMKFEDGAETSSTVQNISLSTSYFLTLARDDDAGANGTGQITLYICTTEYCTSGGNLVSSYTVDCGAGEQNDFRYLYWVSSYNTASHSAKTDGTIINLEYKRSLP